MLGWKGMDDREDDVFESIQPTTNEVEEEGATVSMALLSVTELSQRSVADRAGNSRQSARRLKVLHFGNVRIEFGKVAANIVLTLMAMIAGVGDIVCLPILTDSLDKHIVCGAPRKIGNTYFINVYGFLWLTIIFILLALVARFAMPGFRYQTYWPHKERILIAVFGTAGFFLEVYSSPPQRTPERLQSLLYLSLIPFTLLVRWLVLRKGVSTARFICTFTVVVGLCIALEPTIFRMHNQEKSPVVVHGDKLQALWLCLFLGSFIPIAVLNVLIERSFATRAPDGGDAIHPLMLAMWLQVWGLLFTTAFFWLDFLPGFGEVSDFAEFSSAFNAGFMCMMGSAPSPGNCSSSSGVALSMINPDPQCHIPIGRFWLWLFFFIADNFTILLLFKYSDGAIYLAIVASLKSPLAAIFWMLFKLDERSAFIWQPKFNTGSIYVLCGLAIMIPAACTYNYLSLKADMKSTSQDNRQSSGVDESPREEGLSLLTLSEDY